MPADLSGCRMTVATNVVMRPFMTIRILHVDRQILRLAPNRSNVCAHTSYFVRGLHPSGASPDPGERRRPMGHLKHMMEPVQSSRRQSAGRMMTPLPRESPAAGGVWALRRHVVTPRMIRSGAPSWTAHLRGVNTDNRY
jgi:hypothetical protein